MNAVQLKRMQLFFLCSILRVCIKQRREKDFSLKTFMSTERPGVLKNMRVQEEGCCLLWVQKNVAAA
jgi:hypothetical protein